MNKDVNRKAVVRMYVEQKLSTVQIGKKVGLTPGAISSILYARGVKIRTGKQAHKARFPKGRNGSLASNWKGGRRNANQDGYIYIYCPDHSEATKEGYVMEHRLVIEKKLGRVLKRTEIVHHRNGIKDDNRLENLELVSSKGEHVRKHFHAVKRVHELEDFIRSLGHEPPP